MLEDIIIGQYYPGDSLIHRLDPRVKIVSALIYMVALFVVNNLVGFSLVIVTAALSMTVSRIPWKFFLKSLRPILILVAITVILNMFLTPGKALLALGPLSVTREGIMLGAVAAVRLFLLVLVAALLTLTTTPVNLTEGIERLLSPGRAVGIPAHELAMMMTIALRFIPTLIEETDKIIKAQKSRGADFEGGNLAAKAKNLVPVLVPLFVSSFRRADELATAMEARCYRGGEGRTRLRELQIGTQDRVVIALTAVFLAAAIASRWWIP
ncbi:MAG TPA: energy-coupling factor transporter transmembrane protein EcfT [Clostridia bacterium]|nr:energy-coupling factor transporter transmembrane protein EcfT [Clostridia bacterium]